MKNSSFCTSIFSTPSKFSCSNSSFSFAPSSYQNKTLCWRNALFILPCIELIFYLNHFIYISNRIQLGGRLEGSLGGYLFGDLFGDFNPLFPISFKSRLNYFYTIILNEHLQAIYQHVTQDIV